MKAAVGPVSLRRFDPDIDLGPGGFNLEEEGWWSGPEGKAQSWLLCFTVLLFLM